MCFSKATLTNYREALQREKTTRRTFWDLQRVYYSCLSIRLRSDSLTKPSVAGKSKTSISFTTACGFSCLSWEVGGLAIPTPLRRRVPAPPCPWKNTLHRPCSPPTLRRGQTNFKSWRNVIDDTWFLYIFFYTTAPECSYWWSPIFWAAPVKPASREWLSLVPDVVSHFSFCLSARWTGLGFQELAENFSSSLSWGRGNRRTRSSAWSLRLAEEQCSVMRCKAESVSFAFGRSAWDWALLMRGLSNERVCDWDCMNSSHLLDHQFAS